MNQETVRCTVYESQTDRKTYVFLPKNKTPEDLPENVKNSLGPFEKFKDINAAADVSLIAVSQSELLSNINKQGFHIQRVKPQE